ncbi:MAG TPA: M48 family metallopeptidase [Steroidobacteraceae bacterium]|jgi:Zn-dependent protease with chaperone function|nr:M48 family metallopeptidase [Steroidobacteraceae bacterium]
MDFYARQEAARRTTRWLLVAFLISVGLVVLAIDAVMVVLVGASEPGRSPAGAVLATSVVVLAIICGASLFKTLSLRAGGGVVARSLGGTRIDRSTGDLALKRLHNVVEEMAIASGVTMPEVYVLENEDGINAFAAGNSPADAAIAVTRGAATRLKREELQGVVAHEFSHILNGDMRLNLRLLGWIFGLLAVAIVARIVLQSSPRSSGRGRKDGAGALMLAALAVMVLGYIGVFFGRLLQAAVSRNRERLADASAVQFTRNPVGLSGALLKIAGLNAGSRLVTPQAEEVAHMLFAAGLPRLMATHPSLEERLKALDPAFRASELPALAAVAARDAERQRAEDAGRGPRGQPEGAAASAFAPLDERSIRGSMAHDIAGLAGTIASENVRYAETARVAIPEGLRDFTESADHARTLVLIVLVSKEPDVLAEQRRILERAYGEEFTARVLGMQALADSLAPALRLPAVQQLFPALRRLSLTERQQLRDVVAALANADARIDVFECCLTLLLATSLDELEAGTLHGNASLMQEIEAVHTMFAILAAQGTGDDAIARRAYEAGISVVLPEHRPAYREVVQWPKALADALARLANLRPFAKKVLIEGLVRCIAHDQKLSVEEGELLRTVCAVLHCPLPPILAPRAAGGS